MELQDELFVFRFGVSVKDIFIADSALVIDWHDVAMCMGSGLIEMHYEANDILLAELTCDKVVDILKSVGGIPCTACRYCTDGCPMHISIPDLFACYNAKKQFKDWNSGMYYRIHTAKNGKASDCIKCGQCEGVCPQHLKITELLEKVSETFEE